MKTYIFALAFGVCGAMAWAGFAQANAPEPVQQHNTNAIWFENFEGLSNASLVVNYPDGTIETFEADQGTPVFKLNGNNIRDGVYRYELWAATKEEEDIKNQLDNGRGRAERSTRLKPFYLSGRFTVHRGAIITPEELKEE